MRKIKLDLDKLQVATFDTTAPEVAAKGTVRGNELPPTYEFCTWASYCPHKCV
jgi:hypothetical protein